MKSERDDWIVRTGMDGIGRCGGREGDGRVNMGSVQDMHA